MSRITVLATVTARAGAETALAEELLSLVAPSRAEAGCLRYDLLQDPAHPEILVFMEDWASLEAHQTHKQTPHFLASRARQEDLVATRDVRFLEALDAVPSAT